MTIKELRILPPLAIGRLGSAPEPLDNYEVEVDPRQPLGFRRLRPAETLFVDARTGEISHASVPSEVRFKSDGRIRPVAPFLEVWALVDEGSLVPLTTQLLAENGLTPADVRWRALLGNIKIFRRTGEVGDKILADTELFSDHAAHVLEGQCPHFREGKSLPLGTVRYIKPTEAFPEIRLRFMPAAGKIYGSTPDQPWLGSKDPRSREPDPNISEVLYDPQKGKWLGFHDPIPAPPDDKSARLTNPANIYAGDPDGDFWKSRGYLDDECDGLIFVQLQLKGADQPLQAFARLGAGPPAFAPDSFPVRTVADDLEQALLGPVADTNDASLVDEAEETVRRAFESVRLMNTAVMNGNSVNGQFDIASTMSRQDNADTGRVFEPIMATSLVDTLAVRDLHQNVLTALRSGTAPWFGAVLRDFNEVGDLSDKGRRKMPAMMRGADGRALTLTRRQVDAIRKAAQRALFQGPRSSPQAAVANDPADKDEETR